MNFYTLNDVINKLEYKLVLAFIPAFKCLSNIQETFNTWCPVHEYLMFKWQLARTSYILGHWQVKMGKLLSIISILVTSSCIGFLILMGSRCVVKLSEELKGTNVDIVKASKHLYPTISICSIDAHSKNEGYIQILAKCNLRYLNQKLTNFCAIQYMLW